MGAKHFTEKGTKAVNLRLFHSSSDKALAPALEVLNSDKPWQQSIEKSGVKINVEPTYDDVSSLAETLQNVNSSADDVASSLHDVFLARGVLLEKRRKTARRPGVWVTRWGATLGQFLASYGGVVEVVKGADQQFGGVAYGALAVLLAVAVHKDQHEQDIERAMEDLGLAFPRLQNLGDIYPERSDRFRTLIARVYGETVQFARECTAWYLAPPIGRFKVAVTKPPKMGVQIKIETIRKLLAEVRWETEVLMQKRIQEMRDETIIMKNQMKEILQAQKKKEDEDYRLALIALREALRISDRDPHVDTQRYKGLLEAAFEDYYSQSLDSSTMTWEEFSANGQVLSWLRSTQSQVLVLSGHNSDKVDDTTLSWLSDAAVLLAQSYEIEHRHLGFFFCQTAPTMLQPNQKAGQTDDRRPAHFRDVLARWCIQIISSLTQPLNSTRLDEIKQLFADDKWSDVGDDDQACPVEAAVNGLAEMTKELEPDTTVTLVLDRVDKCYLDAEDFSTTSDHDRIMDHLVELARKSHRPMKILAITHPRMSAKSSGRSSKRRAAIEQGLLVQCTDWNRTC